jgi:DNA-binding transcriptional LysR family regulator
MNIDVFRGIAPFVAVAEELSFRKAAIRLGVTPAAVSKAVQMLEADVGVKLLTRTSRTVSLTREGTLFFSRCRDAVTAVSGARTDVGASRQAPHGEATVSVPFLLAPPVIAALGQLRHRHPRLLVRLEVTDKLARFGAEGVDVAVRIGTAEESLLSRLLRRTRWRTVATPAYLARRGVPETPEELALHECLVFLAPNGRRRAWSFASGAVTPSPALLVDHGPSLHEAVRAGMGIGQLLDFMVERELAEGSLVAVLDDVAVEGPPLRALAAPGRPSANVKAIFAELGRAFAAPGSSTSG